ncbi:MAG: O-antigen ligase family protein [Candidatus Kerfeldbacteria bacterium]|nr:O-antigen ligase family protein [Candidatus Kerfeldbacteria bacterium]
MNQLKFKHVLIVVAILGLVEAVSFLGFRVPAIGQVAFLATTVLTAILTWRRLETGLLILFAELFMGGKGYLLSYDLGDDRLSIRIAVFVVVLATWLIKHRGPGNPFKYIPPVYRRWLVLLGIIVAFGVINGLIRHRGAGTVYFDANAFLFFGLVPVLFAPSINWRRQAVRTMTILAAAAIILGIKSLFSLGIFAHLEPGQLTNYYRWIRTTGVGEIAYINGNSYRVFFQSQIFGLFAAFILAALLLPSSQGRLRQWWLMVPIILGTTAVMISLSRSFWIGGAVGALAGTTLAWRHWRWTIRQALFTIGLGTLAVAYTLTSWALHFQYPFPPSKDSATAKLIGQRFQALGGEAAASSRLNQLKPLRDGIIEHPVIGSGFGTKLTYMSNDPRQQQSPDRGIFTTTAFEWGYLDLTLKLGLLGLAAYLGLLWIIMSKLWKHSSRLSFGILLAILSLSVVHVTTPYLNHPIGIGLLLLGMSLGTSYREDYS